MNVNLWYCEDLQQWRWTLTDRKKPFLQESGQRPNLKDAMVDVANTVEYTLDVMQIE